MKLPTFTSLINPFIELVIPERCRICGSHQPDEKAKPLCRDCLRRVNYLGASVCRQCGEPFRSKIAGGSRCGACVRQPPPWDQAQSIVRYDAVTRELLSRLKYKADTTVLPALKMILQPSLAHLTFDPDYVIPVPLHPSRLRHRGMNQAVHLARLLFPDRSHGINTTILQRHRATQPQTGLDGAGRRRNLGGAFRVADPFLLQGRSVCIVDDVYTTGTTVAECCRALKKARVREIRVITIARVVRGQ